MGREISARARAVLAFALAALGMALFHHKIRKPPFPWFVPLCLLGHAAVLAWAALRA